MQRITTGNTSSPNSFDPTAASSGSFNMSLANGGWLVIINDSPCGLILSFSNGAYIRTVPPTCIRSVKVPTRIPTVAWQVEYSLPTGQAAVSFATGECYDLDEWTAGEIFVPLVRQVNQGNPTTVGSVQQVINDNNVSGTEVVESTQTGSSGQNLFADNAGNAKIAEYVSGVYTILLQVISGAATAIKLGSASPARAVQVLGDMTVNGALHATADTATTANNVAAANVNAGNLGTGVNMRGTWYVPTATDRGFSIKDNSPNIEFDVLAPNGTARGFLFASIDSSNVLHGCFEGTSNGVCRVGSNDPTLGNPRVATYIGTTDPAGRAGVTVQDGDVWLNA